MTELTVRCWWEGEVRTVSIIGVTNHDEPIGRCNRLGDRVLSLMPFEGEGYDFVAGRDYKSTPRQLPDKIRWEWEVSNGVRHAEITSTSGFQRRVTYHDLSDDALRAIIIQAGVTPDMAREVLRKRGKL